MTTSVDVLRGSERLRGTLSPLRRRLLEELREPASAAGLAARLGESRRRVNYHLREMEKGGLVELVELRQRRGRTERVMRTASHEVIVAPAVIGDLVLAEQDRFAAARCSNGNAARLPSKTPASSWPVIASELNTAITTSVAGHTSRFEYL